MQGDIGSRTVRGGVRDGEDGMEGYRGLRYSASTGSDPAKGFQWLRAAFGGQISGVPHQETGMQGLETARQQGTEGKLERPCFWALPMGLPSAKLSWVPTKQGSTQGQPAPKSPWQKYPRAQPVAAPRAITPGTTCSAAGWHLWLCVVPPFRAPRCQAGEKHAGAAQSRDAT